MSSSGECVKVIVRCRPMNEREFGLKCKTVVEMDSTLGQCAITNPQQSAPPKRFTFDGAYWVDSTTEGIYNDIAYPLVEGVTEGYNGTIFAYGQTGCGKSYTMQGVEDPPSQRGIIPRAFGHVFETISVSEDTKFLVNASYLEIYNEEIRDLLGKDIRNRLELKEHPERGVYVAGLSMHTVHDVKDCEKVMTRGWKNRTTASTLMNADSSRSHSIFTIHLEMGRMDEAGEEHIRVGKLNLVDLAGSERQAKTGATGGRLKEAAKINLSLSALGNVISALVDGKSKHIPYRDSKLTRLLQDSLGGNTKTLMVACLSPADNNYDETLSTLRYANRAKNIKNKPKINEDPKDALLRQYHEEIERLKAMLEGRTEVPNATPTPKAPTEPPLDVQERIAAEKRKLEQEFENRILLIQRKYEAEKGDREKLQDEIERLQDFYTSKLNSVDQSIDQYIRSPGQEPKLVQEEGRGEAPVGGVVLDMGREKGFEEGHEKGSIIDQDDEIIQVAEHISSRPIEEIEPQHQDRDALIQKLHELQQQLVGGEQANNLEVKERRSKRKRHAEEKKRRLAEAIQRMGNMEDDGIMLGIYEDIGDDLKAKTKLLNKAQAKTKELQQEITDLQSEFEFDRVDYLDTIRKQEQQIKLQQAILDRVQSCIRRDCNYSNFDRIKSESKWSEETNAWVLPNLVIERTSLPSTGSSSNLSGKPSPPNPPPYYDNEEDKYLQRLNDRGDDDIAKSYFKISRQEKLLNMGRNDTDSRTLLSLRTVSPGGPPGSMYDNSTSGLGPTSVTAALDNRAALVHGELLAGPLGTGGLIDGTQSQQRKPQKLEALPLNQQNRRAGRRRN